MRGMGSEMGGTDELALDEEDDEDDEADDM